MGGGVGWCGRGEGGVGEEEGGWEVRRGDGGAGGRAGGQERGQVGRSEGRWAGVLLLMTLYWFRLHISLSSAPLCSLDGDVSGLISIILLIKVALVKPWHPLQQCLL